MIRTLIILWSMTFFFAWPVVGQEAKKVKVTDLEKIIAESKGPLVINFWATFCKPCIEEIPHFQKLQAEYENHGLQVLFVSLDLQDDFPAKVNAFIKKRKMASNWLDETNADYFCPRIDQAWTGAIPATLFIHNKRNYRKFIEEPLSEEGLANEIRTLIGKSH
jgi:thiol-disulfide isomerase/thioredoxin